MSITSIIRTAVVNALAHLYPNVALDSVPISINQTKPEFTGHYTVVLFPFVKALRCKPDEIGNNLGNYLQANCPECASYAIVSGFLNITVSHAYWQQFVQKTYCNDEIATYTPTGKKIMVEYSSPNTNKPLHFGHLRNIFLGAAVSNILANTGNEVVKANLINDRGIHICKSMIAWQRYADGATPESTGIKGDHLVGDYYVKFNDVYKQEVQDLVAQGMEAEKAEKQAPILLATQDMLKKWEDGDAETIALWERMNGWVYVGFNKTYNHLGITFDQYYYESKTYLLGKQLVLNALDKNILFKKENGSIWIDLTADGLDEKLLLRGDGTSVYMTQDLGTAVLKYNDFHINTSVYVIADEQNYHMQVLKLILQKMGEPVADTIHHLSYGMVELPSGKMKSREGTVVDADDMVQEMVSLAKEQTIQAGKSADFTEEEAAELYQTIGLGALKFYLLRVDPKKKMIFDPKESIDLHGFTATFIQYAHARICSILRQEQIDSLPTQHIWSNQVFEQPLAPLEIKVLLHLEQYTQVLQDASTEYNPSELCNYCFQLAQLFNSFYDVHSIRKAENEEKKILRMMIAISIIKTLRHAMGLLGIKMPTKM